MEKLLLTNGLIYSMEAPGEFYQHMMISNGKIIGLLNTIPEEIFKDDSLEIIDLMGQCVLPSFTDGHVHLVQTGLNYLGLNLSGVNSIEETLSLIEKKAEKTPAGKLIRGIHFDVTRVIESRFPTRKELDAVSPNHPVWINSYEYHMSAVNSMALHLVNLPYFIDGIARDERNLPKGFLTGKASAFFRNKIFEDISNRDRLLGVNKAIKHGISKGITSIHAMEGGYTFHDKDVEFILNHRDSFPIDIHLFYQSYDVEKVVQKNLKRIGGDLFVDGAFGSRTAALFDNYSDGSHNGKLYFNDEELDYFIKMALKNNLQIALHTIGDRAIDQALMSFKKNLKDSKDFSLRHRLEHFELPSQQHIQMAKDLNIDISVQPVFEYLWGNPGEMYEKRLGERSKYTNPFNQYLKQGLRLIGGSDSDVTELNPILGIHSAVNHPKVQEKISVYEAIKMFTYNGQYSVSLEESKGSLVEGKDADFIILDKNPFEISKDSLKDIQVIRTFKAGKCIYSRGD